MLTRLLSLAAIISLSVGAAANAERAEHFASAVSKLVEPPVTNYTVVFDHPEAVLSERRPIGSALALVAEFLAESSGFPAPRVLPPVEFASSARIAAVRYRDLSLEPELLSFSSSNASALDMVYDDARGILYLSELWTGGSPAEFSVLIHGLVNHAQREAGLSYGCSQEREQVAYAARDAWLRLFGQT